MVIILLYVAILEFNSVMIWISYDTRKRYGRVTSYIIMNFDLNILILIILVVELPFIIFDNWTWLQIFAKFDSHWRQPWPK